MADGIPPAIGSQQEVVRNAVKRPERHADLIMRVGGYSAHLDLCCFYVRLCGLAPSLVTVHCQTRKAQRLGTIGVRRTAREATTAGMAGVQLF